MEKPHRTSKHRKKERYDKGYVVGKVNGILCKKCGLIYHCPSKTASRPGFLCTSGKRSVKKKENEVEKEERESTGSGKTEKQKARAPKRKRYPQEEKQGEKRDCFENSLRFHRIVTEKGCCGKISCPEYP